MATSHTMTRGRLPTGSSRMLEWGVLGCVVAVLLFVLGQKMREVQGQGESAAIRSTLGALRTAMVLHQLQLNVAGVQGTVASAQRNPFDMLASRPVNYGGETRGAAGVTEDVLVPGRWVFDPDCRCVGYAPLNPQWLDSPSGSATIWLQISMPGGAPQLNARELYRWQGVPLD
jgi:hypothetical protein